MRPVIYQLFVRHFSNMVADGKAWGTVQENGCGKFNDISEVVLKSLANVGVTHVWLTGVLRHATQTAYAGNPELEPQPASIVKGIAGSPYAVLDYFDVDPDLAESVADRLGEFKALLQRCRTLGLIPMMDFVPNHVSRAYQARSGHLDFGRGDDIKDFFSPLNGYFYVQPPRAGCEATLTLPEGGIWVTEAEHAKVTGNNVVSTRPSKNDWYETVKLNYGYDFTKGVDSLRHSMPHITAPLNKVPKTWRIMDEVMSFWQDLGIGGFRCDMAHLVPMEFWRWAISRARVRDADVLFIGEAYNDDMKTTLTDPAKPLLEAGFAGVYDAPVYHLEHEVYEMGKWANDFDKHFRNDNTYQFHGVRYIENHDEPRVCSPLHWGGKGDVIISAAATLAYASGQGPVLIYNGQEVGEPAIDAPTGYGGDNGRTSIFDYTCLPALQPWYNNGECTVDNLPVRAHEIFRFHRYLLRLMQHPALARGAFYGLNWCNMDNNTFGREPNEQASGHWVYAFLRHDAHTHRTVLVVVNLSPTINFYNLRVSVSQDAIHWCKLNAQKLEFFDLIKVHDEPTLTLPPYEVITTGVPVALRPGMARILEIRCAG